MGHESIKQIVEEVLVEDPEARDNDIWLIIQVLRKLKFKIYIDYSQLNKIPSFETITRCRRLIQNTENHCGASEGVAQLRKKIESQGMHTNSQLFWGS